MTDITSSIQKKTEALIEDLDANYELLEAYRAMSVEELAVTLIERGFTLEEMRAIQENEYEGFDDLLEKIQPSRIWWFAFEGDKESS